MTARTKATPRKPKASKTPPRLRVKEVVLKGFKPFKDEFRLEIPPPEAADDLDVLVLGSINGVGKTSVLEGIAVLMLAGISGSADEEGEIGREPAFWLRRLRRDSPESIAPFDAYINVDADKALVKCKLLAEAVPEGQLRLDVASEFEAEIELGRGGTLSFGRDPEPFRRMADMGKRAAVGPREAELAWVTLLALGANPVVCPPLMYFHSYRRVQERNPELRELTDTESTKMAARRYARYRDPDELGVLSRFKMEALNALLAQRDLLETPEPEGSDLVLNRLNELVRKFAGGVITKVRPVGNQLHILLELEGQREPVPVDALSSGQKEIISTLFHIWFYARHGPSVVLIDEPELHLHPAWHDDFIRELGALAPWNQYIIATHSEKIASSVPPGRIRIIEP